MGINSFINILQRVAQSIGIVERIPRNTVTVTGDIIYPPGVTLRLRNCYVTPCYAVTFEAKKGIMFVTLGGEKCHTSHY